MTHDRSPPQALGRSSESKGRSRARCLDWGTEPLPTQTRCLDFLDHTLGPDLKGVGPRLRPPCPRRPGCAWSPVCVLGCPRPPYHADLSGPILEGMKENPTIPGLICEVAARELGKWPVSGGDSKSACGDVEGAPASHRVLAPGLGAPSLTCNLVFSVFLLQMW